MIIALIANVDMANAVKSQMQADHHGTINTIVLPKVAECVRASVVSELSASPTEQYINLVINPNTPELLKILRDKKAQVVHQYELVSKYKRISVVIGDHYVSETPDTHGSSVLGADEVLSECLAMHRKYWSKR